MCAHANLAFVFANACFARKLFLQTKAPVNNADPNEDGDGQKY